ncbi:Uncharacterized protein Fot_01563 [Forsythia ovata]|uniref:SAC3/GANP/THP3 conserved domain-containing protein n=1 Tax=Forsythia ovata TaxID=205694 RepID=A0ABD1X4F3_9LAMI
MHLEKCKDKNENLGTDVSSVEDNQLFSMIFENEVSEDVLAHWKSSSGTAWRERLRCLVVFDRLHGDPAKPLSTLVVKKLCRNISTNNVQDSDVRPVSVLEDTLNYLLNLLKSDCHFENTRSLVERMLDWNCCETQGIDQSSLIDYQYRYVQDNMLSRRVPSRLLKKDPLK